MTIERLTEVIPPIAMPEEPFGGPWEAVEAEIGTSLPQDYKDFCRLFGLGEVMEFLAVFIPKCQSPYVRLEHQIHAVYDCFVDYQDLPYPIWPNIEGLLPIGRTDYGDELFWIPIGPPSTWSIMFWDRGMMEFEAFDCDLTDFLAGIITGEIQPREFPDGLDECEYLFKPSRSRGSP